MTLLDTNVLSEWMRPSPDPSVIGWLDAQPGDQLFLPVVTEAEIQFGIALLPEGRRRASVELAAQVLLEEPRDRCLALDCEATPDYARIMAFSRQAGRPISVEDAQIASIALRNGLRLATRNIADFDFLGELEIVNPWDPDSTTQRQALGARRHFQQGQPPTSPAPIFFPGDVT